MMLLPSSILYVILITQLQTLKIAIVGGGPSGIFLSRLLREKRGNEADDIMIFEKADRLAPLFDSRTIAEGKALDFGPSVVPSKSFIPGDSNQFNGVYGKLQDIFDEVNTIFDIDTTLTDKPIEYYNIDSNMVQINPVLQEILGSNPPMTVIPQFLKQLAYGYTVQRDTTDTSGVYEIGICEKGETIIDFASRNNMPHVAKYIASLTELLAAEMVGIDSTGVDRSCAYMFRIASTFIMEAFRLPLLSVYTITSPAQDALITSVLQSSGFDQDTIQTVQTMLNPTIAPPGSPVLHFDVGFQTVMEHIGQIEGINGVTIKLNAEVVDIVKQLSDSESIQVTVQFSNDEYRRLMSDSESSSQGSFDDMDDVDTFEFDAVFLTIRPIDAVNVLQPDSTAYELYDEAKNEAGSYTAILWNSENWFAGTGDEEGIWVAAGSQFYLDTTGTEEWYKILENQCFPYGYYRDFADEPFFVSSTYTPRTFDAQNDFIFQEVGECVTQMMQYLNDVFGLDLTEEDVVATYQINYYPYIIGTTLESTGWYDKFEAIQGKDGLFFFGEVFSTQGVANVLRYIDVNIDDVALQLSQIEANIDGEENSEEEYSFNSKRSDIFDMIHGDTDDKHANVTIELSDSVVYTLSGLFIVTVVMTIVVCIFCKESQASSFM